MPSSRYYKFKEISHKERIKKIKVLFFSFSALILCLSIIWLIFISSLFKITDINIISDNADMGREDIVKTISNIAPFGLRENLLFLSKFRLQSELTASFPAITDIAVNKNFLHTLTVNFKKRIPVGIWCRTRNSESSQKDCYYFDKEGIIFMIAPQTEGSLILKITDFSKGEVLLGDRVSDNNRIHFIISFRDFIHERNQFRILEFKIKPSFSIDLEAITDKNWSIYLDDTQDPIEAANNLLTSLEESVKNTGNLEYIDLRIPSRIFYKNR